MQLRASLARAPLFRTAGGAHRTHTCMSHGAGAAQDAAAAQATTAVSAATEALVAPVLQLARSAEDAKGLLRLPRALELCERALALAEASFPQSTLLIAKFLADVICARRNLVVGGTASVATPHAALAALQMAAWRSDEQLQGLSQRCLGLLRARWHAGTLLTLTPEEACFAAQRDEVATPEALGVEPFVICAADAIQNWQHTLLTRADDLERLHGVHEALCAALEMHALTQTRSVHLHVTTFDALSFVLWNALDNTPWRRRLRATCGQSRADEDRLRELQHFASEDDDLRAQIYSSEREQFSLRAAADVARHGLRSCALPFCGATEAYPKTYKLCGRCRGVAYCCAAHCAEDWKRHKREDGCEAPP
jgi:hypothetical protein